MDAVLAGPTIYFTTGTRARHVGRVRFLLCLTVLVFACAVARAQEQESKLLERLLKPNTTLANEAQNKPFDGGGQAPTKQAAVRGFFVRNARPEREFTDTRSAPTRSFLSRFFSPGSRTADVTSRDGYSARVGPYATREARAIREAPGRDRSVASVNYAGNRPFLVKGKSQKALSAQDTPMTVDQVRELLNRNK